MAFWMAYFGKYWYDYVLLGGCISSFSYSSLALRTDLRRRVQKGKGRGRSLQMTGSSLMVARMTTTNIGTG